MNYKEISEASIGFLYKAHASVRKSGIAEKIISLVELRVSQINGCAYCCGFHAQELRDLGFEQGTIDKLPGWKLTNVFNTKEKLALEWAESLTNMDNGWNGSKEKLVSHFTQREIVELTVSITLMNALNKLRMTLGEED